MEPEKKRTKKDDGKEAIVGGGNDNNNAASHVASLEALPDGVLKHIISYAGTYMEDCKSLVTLRAASRRLRSFAEQELESSVLDRKTPFNRYNAWMFDEEFDQLRTPSLGLKWSEDFSTTEMVVKSALNQASSANNSLQGTYLSHDKLEEAKRKFQSGAEQIQLGDFRSRGKDRMCNCNSCPPPSKPIDREDWTYGWGVRATCQIVSKERARELIAEICELEGPTIRQKYLETHLELREHPDLFDTQPNSAKRRQKYSNARRSAVLLAVADKESQISHACISFKGHKGCKVVIRTEDVIFFRTQSAKQEIAFYYQDEYCGRSAVYADQFHENDVDFFEIHDGFHECGDGDDEQYADYEYYGDY